MDHFPTLLGAVDTLRPGVLGAIEAIRGTVSAAGRSVFLGGAESKEASVLPSDADLLQFLAPTPKAAELRLQAKLLCCAEVTGAILEATASLAGVFAEVLKAPEELEQTLKQVQNASVVAVQHQRTMLRQVPSTWRGDVSEVVSSTLRQQSELLRVAVSMIDRLAEASSKKRPSDDDLGGFATTGTEAAPSDNDLVGWAQEVGTETPIFGNDLVGLDSSNRAPSPSAAVDVAWTDSLFFSVGGGDPSFDLLGEFDAAPAQGIAALPPRALVQSHAPDQQEADECIEEDEETLARRVELWQKDKKLRALLATLHEIAPKGSWTPLKLSDLLDPDAVRQAYRESLLVLHPDKQPQKVLGQLLFNALRGAWTEFQRGTR